MSDPVVDPSGLALYLGQECGSDERASLILRMAQQLCEGLIGAPLPDGSAAVVLDVASRAYVNPGSVQYQTEGPFSASFGKAGGGLYLTKTNKQALRQLVGGGGAFSVDLIDGYEAPDLPAWDLSIT